MSTCAVMVVRDEADMIEVTVRHLLEQVDELIVCDHRSTDGTREILAGLPVIVRDDHSPYEQAERTTELALEALERGHTWVLPCDADEIWYHPELRIGDYLETVPLMAVKGTIYTHVPTVHDPEDPSPLLRLPYRRVKPGKRKVVARSRRDLRLTTGNHRAEYEEKEPWVLGLALRHYPYRSKGQTLRKIRNHASRQDLRHPWKYRGGSDEEILEAVWEPLFREEVIYDPFRPR
jgi:glycosyltransferase involved in cell wall biosynthesis